MKELLKNWEWKKLGELITNLENGNRPKGGVNQISAGIPSIGGEHLNSSGSFDFKNIKYIPKEFYYSMNRGKIKKRDILIVKDGATTGKVSFVEDDFSFEESAVNEHVFIARADTNKIVPKYLFYTLFSNIGQAQIMKTFHGSAIGGINSKFVDTVYIPLPPLPIQRKIVAILERAEKLKNLRQEANDETNTIIQALFYEMFGDPVKNEKGYNVKPLVEICHRITDGTHVTPKYTEKGTPFLRVTDLTNSNQSKKFISEDEHKELIKRCKPEKGDILYSKNGTIGIAKLIDWDYEFSIFVSLCLIKPKIDVILPKYLEIFLNTPFALRQALLHSKKGTITNLHLIEIKKILVPIPSLKEQKAFLKRIEQINNIQNKQTQSTQEINTLFDALMQKAFSGELA